MTTREEVDHAAQQEIQDCINNMPNHAQLRKQVGKKQGLMWTSSAAKYHPAAPLLNSHTEEGCPVYCGTNWNLNQLEAEINYGAHPPDTLPEAL